MHQAHNHQNATKNGRKTSKTTKHKQTTQNNQKNGKFHGLTYQIKQTAEAMKKLSTNLQCGNVEMWKCGNVDKLSTFNK